MGVKNTKKLLVVWQVATWLRDHLDKPMPVARLAARAGMSERNFHRAFREIMRETPVAHLQRLRLERAALWLAYSGFPVIDAALAGGYDSREAFTRMFRARFGCSPGAFRQRLRQMREDVPPKPPAEVGAPYEITLPPMLIAAWPHLGPSSQGVAVWLRLGRWARERGLLTPHTLPVSVLYDDEAITPSDRLRMDAAVVLDPGCRLPEKDAPPFAITLPGGRHAILPYEGTIYRLGASWDWFTFRWFPASGLALRDMRMLMLHDPHDVPTCACDYFPVILGKPLRCRLCIPIDRVPAPGLPPFFHNDSRQRPCKELKKI